MTTPQTFRAGERVVLRFAVKTAAGAAQSLAGYTVEFAAARKKPTDNAYAPGGLVKLSTTAGHMTIADPATGVVEVILATADTSLLLGAYDYALTLIDGAGQRSEVAGGRLVVSPKLVA